MLPTDQAAFDALLEGLTSDGRVSSGMKDALRLAVVSMASELKTLGESAERYDIVLEKQRYFKEHHNLITYLDEVQDSTDTIDVDEFTLKFKTYYKAKESLLYQLALALRTILDIHEADLGRNKTQASSTKTVESTKVVNSEFDATSLLNKIGKLERDFASTFTGLSNQITALSNAVDTKLLHIIEENNIQIFNLSVDLNAKIDALKKELDALKASSSTTSSTTSGSNTATGSNNTSGTSTSNTFTFTGTTEEYIRGDGSYAPFPTIPKEVYTGTVKSVGLYMPIGFKVSNTPITKNGTLVVEFMPGYSLSTNTNQAKWDEAYSWGDHADAGYLIEDDLTWSAISGKPNFAVVATSGDYNDLSNKPTIPLQANADWNATSGIAQILNKPTLFNGTWAALSGKPTNLSQFTNDLGNYGGWITGINSSMVTNALGYTPYNSSNPAGYITSGSLTWGNISGRPTHLSQFTNDLGNYGGWITGINSTMVTNALGYTPYNSSNPAGYITGGGRAYPRRWDGGDINFIWSGQGGQPSWLWGGNDGTNMYVYNPSNFSVSYASSSGNADTVDGWHRDDIRNAGNLTNQTGMWTSAARPGPYRLYRRDDDSNYSVQTYWTGSYWRLYGYNGDSGHADTHVGYADYAGNATNATNGRYVYDNGTYSGSAAYREASSMHVYYASLGRIVYNNGAYSGSGWVEASDLGVRYANSSAYSSSSGNADTVDGWHRDDLRAWGNHTGIPGNLAYWDSWYGSAYLGSNGDLYMGWAGVWTSSWFNQAVKTNSGVTFSTVTASAFYESSDSRLKELLQEDYQAYGIGSIQPKLYNKNGNQEVGYFAQDFQGVLPSAVTTDKDGMLALSYTQVHTAKIAMLEQEVRELKAKLNAL